MLITAHQKYLRQTPTRLRLVAAAVRAVQSPHQAMQQLSIMNKKAARTLHKIMTQAVANAQHNHNISIDDLVIREILVMEGPQYKRFQPVSRGRAHDILKRTSHVKIVLESIDTSKPDAVVEKSAKSAEASKTEEAKPVEKKDTKSATSTKSSKSTTKKTVKKSTSTTKKTETKKKS